MSSREESLEKFARDVAELRRDIDELIGKHDELAEQVKAAKKTIAEQENCIAQFCRDGTASLFGAK